MMIVTMIIESSMMIDRVGAISLGEGKQSKKTHSKRNRLKEGTLRNPTPHISNERKRECMPLFQ